MFSANAVGGLVLRWLSLARSLCCLFSIYLSIYSIIYFIEFFFFWSLFGFAETNEMLVYVLTFLQSILIKRHIGKVRSRTLLAEHTICKKKLDAQNDGYGWAHPHAKRTINGFSANMKTSFCFVGYLLNFATNRHTRFRSLLPSERTNQPTSNSNHHLVEKKDWIIKSCAANKAKNAQH